MTTDVLKALLEALKQHPEYAGWSVFAFAVIVALFLGLSFLKPVDVLKAWWEQRKDAKLDAANVAIEELSETLTWLRVALDVGRDSVERVSRLRQATSFERKRAIGHLADWTQRLFGFLKADINKVTLWVPDGDKLTVDVSNGMRPESADEVYLALDVPAAKRSRLLRWPFIREKLKFVPTATPIPAMRH